MIRYRQTLYSRPSWTPEAGGPPRFSEGTTVPKIGLLSDSHGRAAITQLAAETLAARGAEMLLHLGDIETSQVIDAMLLASPVSGEPIPVRIVFGNTDWQQAELARHARRLNVTVDDPIGRIELEDRELTYMHGHDTHAAQQALSRGVAWLCHGHTHKASDSHRGPTRVINPGALFRTPNPSVALLDTNLDELTFLQIERC